MTLTLILMRHAKSDWDDPTLEDHDRPLNERGRGAASALGRWMRREGWLAEEAFVSTALRTKETFARACDAAGSIPKALFDSRLYHATPERMLTVLNGATRASVLMIAHNPGIAEFASAMALRQPVHQRFRDYPTGATTVFRIDRPDWASIGWRDGKVADFVIPRELE